MNPVEQTLQNLITQDVKDKTDFVFDSLVNEKQNRPLPENIFVGYFLPFFAGKTPVTRENAIMADWISVAGTPMSEVDIIDVGGKVLFTVPALFDTNMIDITRHTDQDSLKSIFAGFDLRSNNLPSIANSYLGHALSKKLEELKKTSPVAASNIERWAAIFTRYGIASDQKHQIADSIDGHDDDLIYG